MAKAKSSKNKDDNNKKKGSKALKSLHADQKKSPMPADKSLNSLKKIQKQLDSIVSRREVKNKQIKELKKKTIALGEQTSALSRQTTALSKQAKKSESQLSKYALNKDLQRIKTALEKKIIQFDKDTNTLSNEITLFKDLTHRVEKKIQTLEIRKSEEKAAPSASQLLSLNKNNERLFKKVSYFEEKLKQFSDTFILPEEASAEFTEQLDVLSQTILQLSENSQEHDTQIKLLQTDTGNLRKSLQRDLESQQQVIESHQNGMDKLEKTVTSLKHSMGEHDRDLKSHQLDLNNKMDQFNDQLKLSQNELKQQIQLVHEPEHNVDLEQFKQFNETLDKLSEQLSVVTEQSSSLQTLFSALQAQQSTDSEHHDELSRQYLTQQQQLENHEGQLVQLLPVISQSSKNKEQLNQISDSLEELAHTPDEHSEQGNDIQSSLLTLDQKIDRDHEQYQDSIDKLASQQQAIDNFLLKIKNLQQDIKNLQQHTDNLQKNTDNHQKDIDHHQLKMVSYQQEQSASVNQLNKQIKTRSLLFSLGLISVLAISTLLLFNQDIFNQLAEKNEADRQELITQIKADITNDTFTQINALSKQNSSIISQQFNQVRNSIKEVRKQTKLISKTDSKMDIQALQNNWREQHQILQEGLSDTQTEQQGLNKTVVQLAEKISTVSNQFQQLQKSITQKSDISPRNRLPDIEIIEIEKIKSSFYTIQLLGALQKESIRSFIRQHQLSDTSRIYQTEFQDNPWYILVQGHYSSFSQAKEKLQQLPEFLQKNGPWIKKLP